MLGGSQPSCLGERPLDGEGKQKKAFKLSLEMADCHLEERGIPSEGKGPETSPGLWFVGVLRKGWLSRVGRRLEAQVMKLERWTGVSLWGAIEGFSAEHHSWT